MMSTGRFQLEDIDTLERKRFPGKKMVIFGVPVVALIGGAAFTASLLLGGSQEVVAEAPPQAPRVAVVDVDAQGNPVLREDIRAPERNILANVVDEQGDFISDGDVITSDEAVVDAPDDTASPPADDYAAQSDQQIAAAEEKEDEEIQGPVFCDPLDYLVNLNTGGSRSRYLKLKVQFEVGKQAACGDLDNVMPRINSDFQSFLRELRPEEITGTVGNYRLKEELLVRVNRSAATPSLVADVHIIELLVQ